MATVYDWLRGRGYWQTGAADGRVATHLLLDGGKACVPPESHAAFLNAYAASVARFPQQRPCVVELRTPVFRMFVDLDTRFATAEAAAAAARGGPGMRRVLAALADAVCPDGGERALVCAASEPTRHDDGVKHGFHVVWPDVLVTAATALELRRRMIDRLRAEAPEASLDLVASWDAVVDASVFRSNGLRMPWSGKGRGDQRFYQLRWVLGADGELQPAEAASVSAMRDALRQLSIRTFDAQPTLCLVGDDEAAAAVGDGDGVVPRALAAYAHVLPALDAALPAQFCGQRFTGLMAADHCFMLRSTSRYCFNLGRHHRTNNVYFALTRRGVSQRCYCRCETAEGRRYGMCKDFASECWPVPPEVTDAFFGPEAADEPAAPPAASPRRAPTAVAPMPSRAAASYLSMEALAARSRGPPPKRRRQRKA